MDLAYNVALVVGGLLFGVTIGYLRYLLRRIDAVEAKLDKVLVALPEAPEAMARRI